MDLERALLERLGEEDVVFSPLGLRRALAAVRRGAGGATRAALDEVLGPEPVPEVAVDDPAVILYMATAAWLAPGYAAGPALAGVDTGPLDAAAINAWARERTRGMIPSVVDRLSRDEILIPLGGTNPCDTPSVKLKTGQSRTACLAFEIPKAGRPQAFEYVSDDGYGDTGLWSLR
jgi:Serpin (serine protease inhibitor)